MHTGVSSWGVVWHGYFERYTRVLMEASLEFPIHFLKIYSIKISGKFQLRVRPRTGCSLGEGGNSLHRTCRADVAVFSKFSLEENRTSALEILGKKVTPVSAGMAAPAPHFVVTNSLCLCVQYLVLMALS